MKSQDENKKLFSLAILMLSTMLIAAPAYADNVLKSPTAYATGTTGDPPEDPEQALVDDVATGTTNDASCALFRTNNPGRGGAVADSEIYYNFSFGLPSGATIDGIEVVVSGYRTGPGSLTNLVFSVRLWENTGSIWTTSKSTTALTAVDTVYTLGGPSDLWGTTWTDDSLSDANFKLEVIPAGPVHNGEHWKLDSVRVRVYYTTTGDLTGQFRTQTQGGWGAEAHGDNPGTYRDANFDGAFPSDLLIGDISDDSALFTTAAAIEAFLPAGGTAGALGANYTDPTTTSAGVLAGQVVALTLSVGFDLYDADFCVSATNLKDLVVVDATSPCYGWTVENVLNEANRILAGLSSTLTASEINECVSKINENFVDGAMDGGFLGLP